MEFTPHEFQTWSVNQVIHRSKFGLFYTMGSGKTVIMLTALDKLINDRLECGKVLIIAPLRVARDTWTREIDHWNHIRDRLHASRVLGTVEQRLKALKAVADLYIINRENVSWLVDFYGYENWPFDTVVIDELSSFKSHRSERFKALRKIRGKVNRIYGLTGTPAPNGLIDLWSQIFLLDRGERLDTSITRYREKYFTPTVYDKFNPNVVYEWALRDRSKEKIYDSISDITVSDDSGNIKLPERVDANHFVDIAREDYENMETEAIAITGNITAVNAAVKINKLLQICNGGIYTESGEALFVHDEKLLMLEQLWEEANGQNILIYYQFDFDKKRILDFFKEKSPDLSVRELRTPASVEAWMNGSVQVGVAHAASCGHGLNLQSGGNIIIWYGIPWSLELYQQANARLHRQGQTKTVFIHHILAADTIDSEVLDRLHGKDLTQQDLLLMLRRKRQLKDLHNQIHLQGVMG